MRKTPHLRSYLVILCVLFLPLVHALPFQDYGHDAIWNETAEVGIATSNGWQALGSSGSYNTSFWFNGTKSYGPITNGTFWNTFTVNAQYMNLTVFRYVNATSGTGNSYICMDRTTNGCFGTSTGIGLGIGNTDGNWSTLNNGTKNITRTPITIGWHQIDIQKYGTTFLVLIDNVPVLNQTNGGSNTTDAVYVNGYTFGTGMPIFYDDMNLWNASLQHTFLTVQATDDVAGGTINNLCVQFTILGNTGQNSTCMNPTVQTYPRNSTSICGSASTCQVMIDQMNNQTWAQIVDNTFATNNGIAAVRMYSTEGTCTGPFCENQLENTGGSCPVLNVSTHQFCQVTDQLAATEINFAMGTNQSRYEQMRNMTELLRVGTANNLQCWKSYINTSKAYTTGTDLCKTGDSASDGDLGILQAYSIACAKQRAGIWLNGTGGFSQDYCADYVRQGMAILGQSGTHGDVKYLADGQMYLANGFNNQVGAPTTNQAYRADYYWLQPLRDFADYTQNTTLQGQVDGILGTINKTFGTNYVPIGQTGHFNDSLANTFVCDQDQFGNNPCQNIYNYVDNVNTWRQIMIIGQYYNTHPSAFNQSMNESIISYWWTHYGGGNASIGVASLKPSEIFSNASAGGVRTYDESYKAIAMWAPLAVQLNGTYAGQLIDRLVNTHWSGTKFGGAAYMGGYFSQYAVMSIGSITGLLDPKTYAPNACVPTSTATYTQNGLSITVNNPLNGSSQSSGTVILNITPKNNNVSGSATPGGLPQAYYNTSFSTDPSLDSWSLGSFSWTSSLGIINNSGADFGSMAARNMNLSNLSNFEIDLNMSMGNITNAKIYFGSACNANTGDDILLERSGAGGSLISIKHDGGNFSSYTIPAYSYNYTRIIVNQTRGSLTVSTGASSWTEGIVNGHTYQPCILFVPGSEMSKGGWNISDVNVTNTATPYNVTTGGSSTMNVSFYNGTNNALYTTILNVANNTPVNYTLTGLSNGTYSWYARVVSQNNNETFPNLTFSINTNIGSNVSVCNASGSSITYNVTGTYNITGYSFGFGTGAEGLYFNTSVTNYNFSSTSSLTLTTFQALINLSAYRLFLNTQITGFNATNGLTTNQTSTQNLIIKAVNGINTVRVDVAGNFSQTYNITATSLTTTKANATGIYDAILTVNATDTLTGGLIPQFNLTSQNASLGGNVSNDTTTNGTIAVHLLQGYAYDLLFFASAYDAKETLLTLNTSSTFYTFSLFQTANLNITIRDEETNAPIFENVTIVITGDTTGNTNYTTSSAYFQMNISLGNYTIKLSSANYSIREYSIQILSNGIYTLNTYLTRNTSTTIFTIIDKNSKSKIPGANVIMQRIVNGTYVTVENVLSDVTGRAQLTFAPNVAYQFYIVKDSYTTKQFLLDPILFTSYNVFLVKSSPLDSGQAYTGVVIDYNPQLFYADQENNLSVTFLSPVGYFDQYAYRIDYPGGTFYQNGSTPQGEVFFHRFNLTGATFIDTVNLTITYNTTLVGTITLSYKLPITNIPVNNTWVANRNNTYGLGVGERGIITTVIVVLAAGLAALVAGPLIGIVMGLFLYGFFVYIGFLPIWSILITMLVGTMYLFGRSN